MPPVTRIRSTNANERRLSLQREYVAGGVLAWYGRSRLALPWSFDDVTAEFGFDIYHRMRIDAQVAACATFFKAAIIEEGITLTPAVTDDTKDGYALANEINDAARRMVDNLETPLDEVLWDMLSCVEFGNKVGELVYAVESNRLNLTKIKVKPSHSVAFVVDDYLNTIGLIGDIMGIGVISGMPDPKNVLPKEKFLIMTFRPVDSDPRGSSILRPAYDAWWRKRQIIPEYLKYLAQFAGPTVIGYTAENAVMDEPLVNEEGETLSTPEEAMLNALLQWRNGGAAAFPGGSKVDITKSEGTGEAFLTAIGQCNLEITKAILTQQLATDEGQFMARAAAQVHQDVLNTLIRQGKRSVSRALGVEVFRRWVGYNWGPEALPLTPRVTLGTVQYEDMTAVMQAIASLKRSEFFVDEQLPAVDKILGLPIRTAEQMEKKNEQLVAKKAPSPSPAPQDNTQQDSQENRGPRT